VSVPFFGERWAEVGLNWLASVWARPG